MITTIIIKKLELSHVQRGMLNIAVCQEAEEENGARDGMLVKRAARVSGGAHGLGNPSPG